MPNINKNISVSGDASACATQPACTFSSRIVHLGYHLTELLEEEGRGRLVVLDGERDLVAGPAEEVDGLVVGDGAEGAVVDLEDGVADVEVVVVLVPAHLGHQDRKVVLDPALHAEPEAPVGVPLQSHVSKLQCE